MVVLLVQPEGMMSRTVWRIVAAMFAVCAASMLWLAVRRYVLSGLRSAAGSLRPLVLCAAMVLMLVPVATGQLPARRMAGMAMGSSEPGAPGRLLVLLVLGAMIATSVATCRQLFGAEPRATRTLSGLTMDLTTVYMIAAML